MSKVPYPNKQNFYFLGIAGIGMSALARYFNLNGKRVAGYDRSRSGLAENLINENIEIHFDDNVENIPTAFQEKEKTLVVYTPAISYLNNEFNYFKSNGFEMTKRSVVLGEISKNYKTVAIAGTHGKTTTSSILTHILKVAGKKMLAFVGGINMNNNSNVILDENAELMITEADEFDKSFLTLHPDILLITSLDADHLDIYGDAQEVQKTYLQLSNQIKDGGTLITTLENKDFFSGRNVISYDIENADLHVANLQISESKYEFDLIYEGAKLDTFQFNYPGKHNLQNAIGASLIALKIGISSDQLKESLATYLGVKRRFEIQFRNKNTIYIDDYAHHPKEIKACIQAARSFYPNSKITGIFQPHLYSRTRDFLEEFGQSLSELDELILMDIYPAREEPILGINSELLLENVNSSNKIIMNQDEILTKVKEEEFEVLITMGAGDIDKLVTPIGKILKDKYE